MLCERCRQQPANVAYGNGRVCEDCWISANESRLPFTGGSLFKRFPLGHYQLSTNGTLITLPPARKQYIKMGPCNGE